VHKEFTIIKFVEPFEKNSFFSFHFSLFSPVSLFSNFSHRSLLSQETLAPEKTASGGATVFSGEPSSDNEGG
jgi:hypothetical protein